MSDKWANLSLFFFPFMSRRFELKDISFAFPSFWYLEEFFGFYVLGFSCNRGVVFDVKLLPSCDFCFGISSPLFVFLFLLFFFCLIFNYFCWIPVFSFSFSLRVWWYWLAQRVITWFGWRLIDINPGDQIWGSEFGVLVFNLMNGNFVLSTEWFSKLWLAFFLQGNHLQPPFRLAEMRNCGTTRNYCLHLVYLYICS